MNVNIQLALGAMVSLLAVHWIYLRILKIAKIKDLVDNPDARKLQKMPVPVLGGIAVFFGLVLGMLAFSAFNNMWPASYCMTIAPILPVMLCGSIMLYVGSIDDIMGLSPSSRLVIEILMMLGLIYGSGMCIDSFHGLWGINDISWWIAVPVTVFAGVGLINAYNMVDGVNGLSSGLCIECSCVLAIICYKRADYIDCALALCYAAALVPFLMHNVFGRRSRMFIGDAGTMVMGLLVSWFVIRILSSDNAATLEKLAPNGRQLGLVGMMLAVACVPVFDTLRVMTARMFRGQSPFSPDKTHLHHIFLAVGVSHSITALCEILLNLCVVLIWLAAYRLGATVDIQLYVVILVSVLLVWGTYFFLSRIVRKHPNSSLIRLSKHTHLGHKQWWLSLQMWLDRGAYDDYYKVFKERLKKNPEEMDDIEKDTLLIVDYLKGKTRVKVSDIRDNVEVSLLRVDSILFDMEQSHVIDVNERKWTGSPKSVTLKKEFC